MTKGRILIIDDTSANLRVLEGILEVEGYEVRAAISGEIALKALNNYLPDLILLDIMMPGMDGFEVCRIIRKRQETAEIPIIFISALVELDEKIRAFESGGQDYISKPFAEQEVLARVRTHLGLYHIKQRLKVELANLEQAYSDLKAAQSQMLHQEKMASIGQLAAGIAHEINNPIGFMLSNLSSLKKYLEGTKKFSLFQAEIMQEMQNSPQLCVKEQIQKVEVRRKELKIDIIFDDLPNLIDETIEGGKRVKQIVQNLKSFARLDEADWKLSDINECLENTIRIVWNELKYKATIQKEYGNIPAIICNSGQLNQVFMNLLINAAQAIETNGEIFVRTWIDQGLVYIEICDTGCGVPENILNRIFEPFFTTKEVGKGTGLGLSISYDIIKKHNGEIRVTSEQGKGSCFLIMLPEDREALASCLPNS